MTKFSPQVEGKTFMKMKLLRHQKLFSKIFTNKSLFD